MHKSLQTIIFCALVSGCSGERLDVGSNALPAQSGQGGSGGAAATETCVPPTNHGGTGSTAPPSPLSWPELAVCNQPAVPPLDGIWQGYIQGDTPITSVPGDWFSLAFMGTTETGEPCGTLTFGDEPEPAPATDPDRGYPAGYAAGLSAAYLGRTALAGARYTLLSVSTANTRLLFTIAFSELWRDWCALQTPEQYPDCSYQCIPPWPGDFDDAFEHCYLVDPSTEQQVSLDCLKMLQCASTAEVATICDCDAQGCRAGNPGALSFDLHIEGDVAEGEANGRVVQLDKVE